MDYSEAKKLVKSRLSEKRWTHKKNVKKMAVKLAKRWGADPEKAAMAAILHDSAKELPKQELLQIFADNAIIAENATVRPAPVWHGIAAAILAQTYWGIEDPAAVEGTDLDKERAFVAALRYLKNRVTLFTSLPLASLDELALTSRLQAIGLIEGATGKHEDVA